jgi:hypothetical protein
MKADRLIHVIDCARQVERTTFKTIQSLGQGEDVEATKLINSDQIEARTAPFDMGEYSIS